MFYSTTEHNRQPADLSIKFLKMASSPDTTSLKSAVPRPFPRAERRLQKKLRSTGQEYVSRTGKIVPAKKVPGMASFHIKNFNHSTFFKLHQFTQNGHVFRNAHFAHIHCIKTYPTSIKHTQGV